MIFRPDALKMISKKDLSWSKRCGKSGEAAFVAVEMQTW